MALDISTYLAVSGLYFLTRENSFMFQKDSKWYFAYHGKSAPGLGCGDLRTTRVQPFSIAADGTTPVFPVAVADAVAVAEP
jgi:hypothetical protein